MPSIFELLLPLISAKYPDESPLLRFWHDTRVMIFPPNLSFGMVWNPPEGKTYIVFALTFGKPRDYFTDDVLSTDDFGFYHRHDPSMVYHWDPCVESIYDVEQYPHYMEVERGTPLDLYFYNHTALTIIWDVSTWFFECREKDLPVVREYIRGHLNWNRALGRSTVEEIADFIKGRP